jgi:4-amino-4-deoxy-L-arabinose transferase-like glycosyltransferase
MSEGTSSPSSLRDGWLAGLIAAGFVVRAALAIALDGHLHPVGDENVYARVAARWLQTGVFDTGDFVRPPLYFAVTAAIRVLADALSVEWRLAMRLLQCAAGAALAIPVFRTASRLGGLKSGRLAAAFVCLDPTLIAYTHLLWPTTLYTLVVSLVFDALDGLERRSAWQWAGVGVLIGAALLLKPVFGIFTLLLALFWFTRLPWAKALRLTATVAIVAAVVMAPWVVRNVSRYGPSILLENQGPYNLWVGNVAKPGPEVIQEWNRLGDPVTRSHVGLEKGVAAIRDDPAAFAQRYATRALNLWGFEFFVVRHMTMGAYIGMSKSQFLGAFWLIELAWFGLLLLAGAGLARALRDPPLRLLWITMLAFTLVVSAMVGATRFRVPFALPIAVTAALGVGALQRASSRRPAIAGLTAAALLVTASIARPSFRKIAAARYEQPRDLTNANWNHFRY